MTTMFAPARPAAAAGRTMFAALAAREMRRFVLNPVFLAATGLTAYTLWSGQRSTVTEIDGPNTIAAVFFGGFGMLVAFWLTRSMRASEQVVGVTPTTLPARTAALCATAIVPFGCGCLTLLAFLHFHPVSDPVYGAFSPPARIAVLVGAGPGPLDLKGAALPEATSFGVVGSGAAPPGMGNPASTSPALAELGAVMPRSGWSRRG